MPTPPTSWSTSTGPTAACTGCTSSGTPHAARRTPHAARRTPRRAPVGLRARGGGGGHPRAGRRLQRRHPGPAGRRRLRRRPRRGHHPRGQRIGAGDRIATRRNDRDLGVANRDTLTVTAVAHHGELIVTPADAAPGDVTPPTPPPRRRRESGC